jgi:ZIP family zinc transporter
LLALAFGRKPVLVAAGIGFSAGIMLLVSAFELLPEAYHASGLVTVSVAGGAGALSLALLHLILPHTHLVKEDGLFDSAMIRSAYLVAIGLVLHDLPEGFALANSYVLSPSLGVFVAIAIAAHNIPEEFAMAVPVVAAKKKRFLFAAAVVSASMEPIGALLGLVFVSWVPELNPLLIAFAAGAMIYVSVHELIPMANRWGHKRFFAVGMLVSGLVYALLAVLMG